MLRGVIFDLFGTLTGAESNRDRRGDDLAEALGADPDDFRGLMRQSFDRRARGQLGGLRETLAHLCDELGLNPTSPVLEEAARIRMASEREMLRPRNGAVEVLRRLRDRGVKLGLLSDCTPEILDLWSELAYSESFDCVVRSCETGWRKPDPRMYEAVLGGLALDSTECIYVGDGGSSELSGAAAVGLRPVLFRATNEEYFRYDEEASWSGETITRLDEIITLLDRHR